ncbi:glycosyltransferase [Dietzia kunjamensis]|uniref:glycosyltransferase n=1 Tax=Dietzia kunjamensis TaxID=322509 RepID=UPI0022B5083C|nr:glycosyltransferase [Dietzia kunjamensis]MCZ4657663.1 glycosyltransferase [Dietzia kunjamensis]
MGTGGVANVISNLVEGLVDRGHFVTIVSITGNIERPLPSAVVTHSLRSTLRTPRGILKAAVRLHSIIRTTSPDVIHSHAFHANMLSRLTSAFLRRSFVLISTTHNTVEGLERHRILSILTASASDMNTAVSKAVASSQSGPSVVQRPTKVIYNGIRTGDYKFNANARSKIREDLGIPDTAFLIITVARLAPGKDYGTLLRAFSLVLQDLPEAQLLAVGEGVERDAILELAGELSLEGKAHFVGERADIRDLLSAADIFVLTSKWEGLGLVISEAMLVGLPCVVSNVGGIPEVAGGHAWLATPGSPSDFCENIIAVARGPRQPGAVEKAREFTVNNFSRESMVAGYVSAYSQALSSKAIRGSSMLGWKR